MSLSPLSDSRDQLGRRRIQSLPGRPGDVLLARVPPGASAEEREEARRRWEAFIAALLDIALRLERESSPAPPAGSD